MEQPIRNQTITVNNARVLEINEVIEILAFDENVMVLNTATGRITVEGKDLKIESLEKRGGNLYAVGDIYGVYFSESQGNKKGFWASVFGK